MTKIRMIEKSLPTYRVIYWAHRPGEVGMRGYYKDVRAKDDDDAIVAFNTWVDTCDDIPDGTDVEIRRIELKTESAGANEAFDGWDGWEEIEGLESALDGIENLAYELRSCVRGAKTGCKDWTALSRHIQNLAAKLDDAAGEMAYKRDGGNESKRV